MPTIQTNTLTGDDLDYAVAVARGWKLAPNSDALGFRSWVTTSNVQLQYVFQPSRDPGQGAPLIWEAGIATWRHEGKWMASTPEFGRTAALGIVDPKQFAIDGPDALTAGLRVLVTVDLGETVHVPDSLPAA